MVSGEGRGGAATRNIRHRGAGDATMTKTPIGRKLGQKVKKASSRLLPADGSNVKSTIPLCSGPSWN